MKFISYRDKDVIIDITQVCAIGMREDNETALYFWNAQGTANGWIFDTKEEVEEAFKKVNEILFKNNLLHKIL